MKRYTFQVPLNDDVGALDFELEAESREDAVRQAREAFWQHRRQFDFGSDVRSPKLLFMRLFIDPDSITQRNIIGIDSDGDALPPDLEPPDSR
jgi:hypothetical protein